tara:strand:+ start:37883 stop:38422 length:540 start_codon:yes stop_codon:yes gene_type:complete
MCKRKVFISPACGPYGARFYIEWDMNGPLSKLELDILRYMKSMDMWSGSDGTGKNYYQWEVKTGHVDDIATTLVDTYGCKITTDHEWMRDEDSREESRVQTEDGRLSVSVSSSPSALVVLDGFDVLVTRSQVDGEFLVEIGSTNVEDKDQHEDGVPKVRVLCNDAMIMDHGRHVPEKEW